MNNKIIELEKTINGNYKMLRKHVALSAVLLFVGSPVVMSAEWAFEPSVSMTASYDDNFRLSTVVESASGMSVHPKIRLSKRTEVSEIKLSGYTYFSRYDNSRFDSEEVMLDFGSSFKNTERSTIEVNASVSRRPLVATEEEDSGRFEVNRDKNSISFDSSWVYKLSASSRLRVSYSGQDVDYSGSTSYTDYQYHRLVGGFLFRQSEKSQYGITLVASRYDPGGTANVTIGDGCIAFVVGPCPPPFLLGFE